MPNEIDIAELRPRLEALYEATQSGLSSEFLRALDELERLRGEVADLVGVESELDGMLQAVKAAEAERDAALARVKELEAEIASIEQNDQNAHARYREQRELRIDTEAKLEAVREWAVARVHNEDSDDLYYRGFGAACRAVMDHTAILNPEPARGEKEHGNG